MCARDTGNTCSSQPHGRALVVGAHPYLAGRTLEAWPPRDVLSLLWEWHPTLTSPPSGQTVWHPSLLKSEAEFEVTRVWLPKWSTRL